VVSDTTNEFYGLQILQCTGSATDSGLAIDDYRLASRLLRSRLAWFYSVPGLFSPVSPGCASVVSRLGRTIGWLRGIMKSFLSVSVSAAILIGMAVDPSLALPAKRPRHRFSA